MYYVSYVESSYGLMISGRAWLRLCPLTRQSTSYNVDWRVRGHNLRRVAQYLLIDKRSLQTFRLYQ